MRVNNGGVTEPMVSHADRCRTRFWSLSIFLTEKASAIVTARGSPSGTCRERKTFQV